MLALTYSFRGIYGRSWWTFLKDLHSEVVNDRAFNGAAALAFYSMLAIFPLAIFLISLLPYLQIPNLQAEIIELLQQIMPGSAVSVFDQAIQEVVGKKRGDILSFGILFTLWASSNGIYATMLQLNATYGVNDSRSYIRLRAVALVLTFAFSALVILSFALIVLGERAENWMGQNFNWGETLLTFVSVIRWMIILLGLLTAFALLYFFGPDVEQDFQFITSGSVIGVGGLILVTFGFKYYVENFGNYNATYGGLGAVIVLMLWFYIMGIVVLLGSEVNALIEQYSAKGKDKGDKKI